jgi:hypothetical protein
MIWWMDGPSRMQPPRDTRSLVPFQVNQVQRWGPRSTSCHGASVHLLAVKSVDQPTDRGKLPGLQHKAFEPSRQVLEC